VRALEATLAALRGPRRAAWLSSPEMRAWLSAAEEAVALADPAADDLDLFDAIAGGPYLSRVLPRGRLDREFRRRAARLARELRARVFARLPAVLAFLTPAGRRFGPFAPDLATDGEEARRDGELRFWFPSRVTLRIESGARIELDDGGVRVIQRGGPLRLRPLETIDGPGGSGSSGIALARRAVSTRRGLRAGAETRGLRPLLARALRLLRELWEEGLHEVLAHTRIVVPLSERGTVSYSLPDRPGVSFINVRGKSIFDLADDLLHETAHHRLHGLEELQHLGSDDGEPRYHSPWRRSLRPLHGILHAAYTFTYRAHLLDRALRIKRAGRIRDLPQRSWLARELAFETGALRLSVTDLEDAGRRGLLTQAGSRLVRRIAERVQQL
jgi:HEXXH motif-containing protein